jgi:hypothetical protein
LGNDPLKNVFPESSSQADDAGHLARMGGCIGVWQWAE